MASSRVNTEAGASGDLDLLPAGFVEERSMAALVELLHSGRARDDQGRDSLVGQSY